MRRANVVGGKIFDRTDGYVRTLAHNTYLVTAHLNSERFIVVYAVQLSTKGPRLIAIGITYEYLFFSSRILAFFYRIVAYVKRYACAFFYSVFKDFKDCDSNWYYDPLVAPV